MSATSSRPLRPRMPRLERHSRAIAGLSFALPAAALIILLILYPVYSALRLSLFEVNFFFGTERYTGLSNYFLIVENDKFWPVLFNTLIWAGGSLTGQFGLGLVAALAINQKVRGLAIIRTILLMPYVVPVIALALFWRWMLDGSFGIVSFAAQGLGVLPPGQSPLAIPSGAMLSVVVANVWRAFPFVMIVYWAALQNIPKELYDAAKVDGANLFQEFRYVTLPGLRNATIVLLVLRGIWTITYFDVIWLITRGGPAGTTEHWPIWIFQEAMGFLRFGFASALGISMGVVLLVLAALYFRASRFGEDSQ